MKIGMLSDIHGNLEALLVALEILRRENVDQIKVLGDCVGYMTNPNECLNLVKQNKILLGNHDYAVINKNELYRMNDYAIQALKWTKKELSKDNISLLKTLPYTITDIEDNYTMVHSSLSEPSEFNYINNNYEALNNFKLLTTQILFVGHTHVPEIWAKSTDEPNDDTKLYLLGGKAISMEDRCCFKLDSSYKYIFNIGSVGQPRDKNPKGCLVLFDTINQTIEYRRFDYPRNITVQKIIDAKLPEFLYKRLLLGI